MPIIQFRNIGQPNGFLDILLKMSEIVFGDKPTFLQVEEGGETPLSLHVCLFVCVCSDVRESQRGSLELGVPYRQL